MHRVRSGCKINLLLNILRRREDGFHELETVMQPIGLFDELVLEWDDQPGVQLSCTHPEVPLGPENLICRAVQRFQEAIGRSDGLRIHLQKNLPVAAGVGGGSGNAAATLLGLNALYDGALDADRLEGLAAELGSDVPFFLEEGPGIATGRGEKVERVAPFAMFQNACAILVNPGFGISTAWAYQHLQFDEPGVACSQSMDAFVAGLQAGDWSMVKDGMFNSLEQPVFKKYPILQWIREALLDSGAEGARLSGSGATVFAVVRDRERGEAVRQRFLEQYGQSCWTQIVPLGPDPTGDQS